MNEEMNNVNEQIEVTENTNQPEEFGIVVEKQKDNLFEGIVKDTAVIVAATGIIYGVSKAFQYFQARRAAKKLAKELEAAGKVDGDVIDGEAKFVDESNKE